jgi:2-polyprenyl-6-methoxyphenol hydroxylase-like FAD-dependent oxidoreductase
MVLAGAAKARIGAENVVTGHRCVGVSQDDRSATAHFVDGNGKALPSQTGDIVIACDGIHSAVRRQFYPDEGAPVFHGINLWRGLTRRKPFLTGASVTRAGGLFTTGKIVMYPILNDIDGEGTQLLNWNTEVFSDTAAAIDWHKPGRLEDFFHIYKDWRFDWLDVADLITSNHLLLTYPMVDREPVKRWTFGRVTLLGDAAHPMYPRGGNGGAQAIIDATTLARLLSETPDPVAALATYETTRLEVVNRIVLENRTAPPDLIIDTVERLTGGKRFEKLSDVISEAELKAISDRYKGIAGYDLETVGRRAS